MPFVADIDDEYETAQQARMYRLVKDMSVDQLRALSLESRRRCAPYMAQLAVDETLIAAAFAEPDSFEILHGLNERGVFERPCEAAVVIQPAIRFTIETAETRWGHVASFRYGWGRDHEDGSLPRLTSPAYPTMRKATVACLDELSAWLIKSYVGWPEDAVPANLAIALGLITERRWLIHLNALAVPHADALGAPTKPKRPPKPKAAKAQPPPEPSAKPARRRAQPGGDPAHG